MRERGLKFGVPAFVLGVGVAPHAGAWIEIGVHPFFVLKGESLPVWERGLKFQTYCLGCVSKLGRVNNNKFHLAKLLLYCV